MATGNTMQESNLEKATILNPMSPEGIAERKKQGSIEEVTNQIKKSIENAIPSLLEESYFELNVTPSGFTTVADGNIGIRNDGSFEKALGNAVKFYTDNGYKIDISLLESRYYTQKIHEFLVKGEQPPTAGYKLRVRWNQ